MAELTSAEKINLALKMVFGIQGLSNTDDAAGLKWYEEQNAWAPFVLNDEMYMETVPNADDGTEADTNVTNNPTLIEKVDIKLTLVTGTNGRAWAAYNTYGDDTSGLKGDWLLPQLFGNGYALRLFQDNGSGTAVGTEITTTEGAWVPSYKLGFIVLGSGHTSVDEGWTSPLWVRVYRYIGQKGVGGSSANVALNDAYDVGRSITADEGPVVIGASTNFAPLQLTPIAYTPSASLAAGQLCIRDGVVYGYDGTRSKWLSIYQIVTHFSSSKADGNYLLAGFTADLNSGFTCPRDATIIGVSASVGSGNQSKAFEIRKNGVATSLISFSVSSGIYSSVANDVDLTSGDILQVYASATGTPAQSVMINVLLAWRIS
jgi:hypothetical protein